MMIKINEYKEIPIKTEKVDYNPLQTKIEVSENDS